jgi:molybdopterin-guanine dinucleotide biosynthesis protein A
VTIAPLAAVVLAGGLGKRMGGGDKPLISIAGKPMLARVIERLRPQVESVVINANGDPERLAAYALPVVTDTLPGFPGPLAGILAGMLWSEANVPRARFIASAAADTPFFPLDLVARLADVCGGDEEAIAVATSVSGTHPIFALWPIRLADDLKAYLEEGRKVLAFADRYLRLNVPFAEIELPDGETVDPFFNVNTPGDAERAAEIARMLDTRGS